MDKDSNKYIAVSYKLYDITDGKSELMEETSDDRPFDFISGLGVALETFENEVTNKSKDEKFDFSLSPEQAYGEYVLEHVLDLDKEIFTINGKFDSEHIQLGAIVPLQNADGNRFNGRVLDITDDKVKMDLNHPLAGKTLRFTGVILENREASTEEVANYMNQLHGHHCGGNCDGNCEGGCDCNGEEGDKDCCGGCGNCNN